MRSESPGRKKPRSKPVSAKMMATKTARPPAWMTCEIPAAECSSFSQSSMGLHRLQHVGRFDRGHTVLKSLTSIPTWLELAIVQVTRRTFHSSVQDPDLSFPRPTRRPDRGIRRAKKQNDFLIARGHCASRDMGQSGIHAYENVELAKSRGQLFKLELTHAVNDPLAR